MENTIPENVYFLATGTSAVLKEDGSTSDELDILDTLFFFANKEMQRAIREHAASIYQQKLTETLNLIASRQMALRPIVYQGINAERQFTRLTSSVIDTIVYGDTDRSTLDEQVLQDIDKARQEISERQEHLRQRTTRRNYHRIEFK